MTTRYEVRDGVAILTLDNPPVNGLSYALRVAFAEALEKANAVDCAVQGAMKSTSAQPEALSALRSITARPAVG